jgi:replicative superfamily II helicase
LIAELTCLGCGKTVVMEMAICRLFQQSLSAQKAIPKILYIAPIKQLVTEKRLEWERCPNEEMKVPV